MSGVRDAGDCRAMALWSAVVTGDDAVWLRVPAAGLPGSFTAACPADVDRVAAGVRSLAAATDALVDAAVRSHLGPDPRRRAVASFRASTVAPSEEAVAACRSQLRPGPKVPPSPRDDPLLPGGAIRIADIGRGSQAASNRHGLNSSLSLMAQEPRLWAVCLSAGGAVIPPVFGRRAPPTAGVLGGLSHR